ncbi:MAG TPA: D-alanyl-D-alanine carboxypeptidase family protein [Candidatus Didemnitutus sp.]|nr:D-alanyl-D-alanine carboxypeptidase family protein [Candidatus Didemnitutus sp.]
MSFLRSLLLFLAFVASLSAATTGKSYLGAIVTDAESGKVIFEDNADEQSPPASMTKLMTFAVMHDKLASGKLTLQTPVTANAADTKMGGTQVWLKEHETFSVEDMLYAMMIQSANDAAHALARTASGSVEAFVAEMNAKAHALGMNHTTFRSPHGLPPADRKKSDSDLTTPRDYAILSRYLVLETDVTKYTSVRERDFGANRPKGPVKMVNHDHLLSRVAGMDGLKTGFTNGAGYCLAGTAERNGRRVIAVVMGSPTHQARDAKVAELIERGFASLPAMASVKTDTRPATPAAAATDSIPTVSTDKKPAPTAPSAIEPLTFHVNPSH